MSVKFIHQDCDPELANDRSLPYNAYLVTYEDDGQTKYDIVQCSKKIEIFDHYWDRYREGLKTFNQTEGRVNPKLWGVEPPKTEKKKK